MFDPKLAFSEEPNEAALQVAFKTSLPLWGWYESEGNEYRFQRFSIGMEGSKRAAPPNAILEGSSRLTGHHTMTNIHISPLGFEWKDLKQDSLVVDVGGGIGSQSMTLAQHFPQLRFLVQDRESVVKNASVVRCVFRTHATLANANIRLAVLGQSAPRIHREWKGDLARRVHLNPVQENVRLTSWSISS